MGLYSDTLVQLSVKTVNYGGGKVKKHDTKAEINTRDQAINN